VQSINVLTIDAELEDKTEPVRIVEEAKGYFPAEAWDEIRYLGKLTLKHDVKILIGQQCLDGFLFEKLVERFGKVVSHWRLQDLLLGITTVPIVATYYFFDGRQFKRAVYLVHDYVAKKVGVVSLFCVNEESSSKVVAHGLGHNRGLRHHVKPVDLMHPELLKLPKLQIEGFCKLCLRELTEDKNSQQTGSEH
jgi:predicted Zn-dependent protease